MENTTTNEILEIGQSVSVDELSISGKLLPDEWEGKIIKFDGSEGVIIKDSNLKQEFWRRAIFVHPKKATE